MAAQVASISTHCPSDLYTNISNQSYFRDNRLIIYQSSHLTYGLAPRCRLFKHEEEVFLLAGVLIPNADT